ncbi:hypothetical protein IVB08_34710 [Bradyrhizobium sp. 173]|uniref:hypothetical protein n=1 Tax=Bradyrhizobium sp. 173 TaxID=2782644 RepID=UPI001FF9D0D9|nr:hypothetical protein [Bradyrhizobium sp. 173]MCK1569012.1 hypothetical protein [Bradyrhizobium sp. 173]
MSIRTFQNEKVTVDIGAHENSTGPRKLIDMVWIAKRVDGDAKDAEEYLEKVKAAFVGRTMADWDNRNPF